MSTRFHRYASSVKHTTLSAPACMVKAYGRRRAFTLASIFGWGVGSLVNASITLTLEADERRLRSTNEFELVPTETLGGAGHLHRRSPSHSPDATVVV